MTVSNTVNPVVLLHAHEGGAGLGGLRYAVLSLREGVEEV